MFHSFIVLNVVQLQTEREKYAYDYDNMQAQLDKAQGQLSRIQKEKENVQQEMERYRDKNDKNQARISFFRASPLAAAPSVDCQRAD